MTKLVHNRTGIAGSYVPIIQESLKDIPAECYEDLDHLQQSVDELTTARQELGRLMQIVAHLTNVCNRADNNSTNYKKSIIDKMNLPDGNYAIDFDTKQIGVVSDTDKPTPRVV